VAGRRVAVALLARRGSAAPGKYDQGRQRPAAESAAKAVLPFDRRHVVLKDQKTTVAETFAQPPLSLIDLN